MSLRTAVGSVVGLAVLVGVAAVVWPVMTQPSRPRTGVQQPDQRLNIQAVVSADPADITLDTTVTAVTAPSPSVKSRIGLAQGWDHTGTAWVKQFGPFRYGDPFTLVVSAPNGYTQILCKLRTVGKTQIKSPPQQVVGKDGKVTCSIRAGD